MGQAKKTEIASASVSDRFQTVIPSQIREALCIACGDRVEFVREEDGRVFFRKAMSEKEKRQAWLSKAFETYEIEDLWSDLKDEPFNE